MLLKIQDYIQPHLDLVLLQSDPTSGLLDLNEADHPYELTRRPETILTVDLAGCGLGNGSCGPGPLERYLLNTTERVFHYTIRPYAPTLGDKAVVAR